MNLSGGPRLESVKTRSSPKEEPGNAYENISQSLVTGRDRCDRRHLCPRLCVLPRGGVDWRNLGRMAHRHAESMAWISMAGEHHLHSECAVELALVSTDGN